MSFEYRGPETIETTADEASNLTFQISNTGTIRAGTDLRLLLENGYRSLTRWEWDITEAAVNGEGSLTLTKDLPESFWERYGRRVQPNTLELCRFKVTEPIDAETVTIRLNAGVTIQSGVDISLHLEEQSPDATVFETVQGEATIQSVAGPPTSLELRPRVVDADQESRSHDLRIFAVDQLRNPVESFDGEVRLQADGNVSELPETVALDEGQAQLRVAPTEVVRIRAVDSERGIKGRSPPLVPTRPGQPIPRFGDIHFHCRYSHDGDRELADAYTYAKNWLNLDFAGVSDHTPGPKDWQTTLEVNDRVTDDEFIALHGWEWSARSGHANIYLRDATVPAGPDVSDPDDWPSFGHFDPDDPRPHDVDWPADALVVPHHTNAQAKARDENRERYWQTYDWDAPNHRARLVEIFQNRGNFEADTMDEEWGVQTGNRGASVRDALSREYHLGFTSGTDNHTGGPTRHPHHTGYTGLTAVLTPSLSRETLWESLNARRTFATTGVRIVCEFEVAETVMGGEGEQPSSNDGTVPARIRIHGTDTIEQVEVICDEETVWSDAPDSEDAVYDEVQLPATEGESYYYLRARQRDDNMVWASPVWIETQ